MELSWRRQRLTTRHRFATSQGGSDERETIVVRLEHEGVCGLGEIVPSQLYGQTLESSESALRRAGPMIGDDPYAIGPAVDRLIEGMDDQRAAIAGFDSALHDWVAKRWGVPVWRLLGLSPARTRTTFTIGVAEPDEIRTKVREALADGYDALKVKIGVEHDRETLAIIREVFDGPLLMDANAAWEPGQAAERIRGVAEFRPALIEQPLRREYWRDNAALRELGVAPIFVDESCERPADVVRLRGLVDGINIKFNKCGGIREALRMIAIARAQGMRVMLGCFVSSSLAIAPPLAIATLADFADLDGHLLLREDPFEGIARDGGAIALGEAPGLGIRERA